MPHQCTECGTVFPDGSKEMLSGCPNCGGTKFQFRPDGFSADEATPDDPPDPPERPGSDVANTVGKAASTVRDLFGDDPTGESDESEPTVGRSPDETKGVGGAGTAATSPVDGASDSSEDAAQASARTDVVSQDELPDTTETDRGPAERPTPTDGTVVSEPTDESPGLEELREELNDQFESIRIVEPGQYELNLMELYDRDEYIIALQENGKYSIQVPETWLGDDE